MLLPYTLAPEPGAGLEEIGTNRRRGENLLQPPLRSAGRRTRVLIETQLSWAWAPQADGQKLFCPSFVIEVF